MLDTREVPRQRVHGDPARVRQQLESWQEPVVFEEGDSPVLQQISEKWSNAWLTETFGDHPIPVRYHSGGADAFKSENGKPEDLYQKMPMARLLEHFATPGPVEYYSTITVGDVGSLGGPMFDDLQALSEDLACTSAIGKVLNAVLIGTAGNVTPLHYDAVARIHGVIRGTKHWLLFPPDLSHFRALEPVTWRSGARKHSRLGAVSLDTEKVPQLRNCHAMETLLRPGDFLYIPPCWWHQVTIPDEITITAGHGWQHGKRRRLWPYWRLKLGNLLFEKTNM